MHFVFETSRHSSPVNKRAVCLNQTNELGSINVLNVCELRLDTPTWDTSAVDWSSCTCLCACDLYTETSSEASPTMSSTVQHH
jgi:hypothetical protein